MADLPLVLALTAGTVAAFNPCGFAMLPAYLTLLVSGTPPRAAGGVWHRGPVVRAVLLSAAMTAGFVTVFGLFGLVVTPLAAVAGTVLPWVTIVIGIVLVVLGGWLLAGRSLPVRVPGVSARPARSARSLYGYGVAYAVASLSCTVGPFLAVTSASLTSGGVAGGLAVFAAYALGMGLVVALLSLAVALTKEAVLFRVRRSLPHVSRVSGVLLVLAGLYVTYYGWYELRVFGGGDPDDPVVGTVTGVQGTISGWMEAGGAVPVAGAAAVLVTILLIRSRRARRSE
ncbi:cytochrome c biogenesis CcdA family protein [Nonomuraea sp. MCN248]|uniref:Cytochrome c biogenesis CcdA family protein n=1 Tax=Nonomuraea corallina TaxID=2989783 RepID=A0ABT4S5A4_9ACTN|nr:cytochrome c biogenesis CcdA family protein [Nonomuraea corallina]MDA0632377.1 cytochrome c biogenesis CcdA family protein [Nonomuraea corallina]